MKTEQPAEPMIEYVVVEDEINISILNEVFDELFAQIEKEITDHSTRNKK
jgi:hypothetical protein